MTSDEPYPLPPEPMRAAHLQELERQDKIRELRRERQKAMDDLETAVELLKGWLTDQSGVAGITMEFVRDK